jgi:hypothetical protein
MWQVVARTSQGRSLRACFAHLARLLVRFAAEAALAVLVFAHREVAHSPCLSEAALAVLVDSAADIRARFG